MKRFTESEKWRDPWFRRLPYTLKLGYLYLLDSVDNAGVWDPDFEAADFAIGVPVPWPQLMAEMGDRLLVLPSGKWHLTRFISFQFGTLSKESKPHQQVLRLLEKHGVSKGYPKGIHTLKDKDKDKDKESDTAEKAAEIYEFYPRKVARDDAIKAILKVLKAEPETDLLAKVKAYAAATARWSDDDRKFIPHPATWFNRGSYHDDPATWIRGNSAQTEIRTRVLDLS